MKKILLILISGLLSQGSFAQSLTQNFENDTLIVYGTTNDWIVDTSVTVYNVSNGMLDVHCERTSAILAPGDSSHFCWGTTCYSNTTTLSLYSVSIPKGDSTMSFISDLVPNNMPGVSYISYCFFNVANPNDKTCLTIEYVVADATGILDVNSKPAMNLPQPNPSDKLTTVAYSLNGNPENFEIAVLNLTGSQMAIYSLKTKAGVVSIPTDQFPAGIYFCMLKQNGVSLVTQKLIVVH